MLLLIGWGKARVKLFTRRALFAHRWPNGAAVPAVPTAQGCAAQIPGAHGRPPRRVVFLFYGRAGCGGVCGSVQALPTMWRKNTVQTWIKSILQAIELNRFNIKRNIQKEEKIQ